MPTQSYILADGTPVKGVTTVLGNLGWNKNQLVLWSFKMGKQHPEARSPYDTTKDALDIGTITHLMAECDIKGKPFEPLPEWPADIIAKAREAYQGYLDWRNMTRLELIESEVSLISEQWRYGGTVDAIAKSPNGHELIDFKTANGLYADHLLQVRAYLELARQRWPDIRGLHILRFAKGTGDFHHHHYAAGSLEDAWEVFKALLIIDRAKYALGKRAA